MQKENLKLKIELVPKSNWNKNLRSELTVSQWKKVREKSYENAQYHCEICNARGILDCHEVWSYDDVTGVQKLEKLEAICKKCHMSHHIGFAITQHFKGVVDFQSLCRHIIGINGITDEEFATYLEEEIEKWIERSTKEWTLDISYLDTYLKENNLTI